MIDLALEMLLDEKVRFTATVFGVGFAAALILVQVGLFFGLLENASITIERLNADLWITSRNSAPMLSQRQARAFMKLSLVARKALEAYLMVSADDGLVNITGALVSRYKRATRMAAS